MRYIEDFEGPDWDYQRKMFTGAVLVVGTAGYFFEYSNISATDILITTISGVLLGQIAINILGWTDKVNESIRFHSLIASFTPLPGLVAGITAIGLRHLFF